MRFNVYPRDVPAEDAARRMGLSLAQFKRVLSRLCERGFPAADPDTGNYDLTAIDRWCDGRHVHLFGEKPEIQARDARQVARDRIAKL